MTASSRRRVSDLDPERVAEALSWLREFLTAGDGDDAGRVRLAISDADGWIECEPGYMAGRGPFADHDDAAMLESLARSVVAASDRFNVYASPYRHRGSRHVWGATRRRHAHCDIDGAIDLDAARKIGAMVVASGSTMPTGELHGHCYVRVDRELSAGEHWILCQALGQYVGGPSADAGKCRDVDVLRPTGTLNHKTDPPHRVRWLVAPDDERVRTWSPEELAAELGITPWPPAEPTGRPAPPQRPFTSVEARETRVETAAAVLRRRVDATRRSVGIAAVTRRLDGLADAVRDAEPGTGNAVLNWAAGRSAAIVATAEGIDADEVREALVSAYLARPIPIRESRRSREREARATVASGWRWGSEHPDEALADRAELLDIEITGGSAEVTVDLTEAADGADEGAARSGDSGTVVEETPRPSWRPVDLSDVLDGSWRPPEPTIGRRSDGAGLLYPGRTHSLSAESEAGKTWLALGVAATELAAGHAVVYLDFEDDAGGVVGRLLTIGVDPAAIRARFAYVRPDSPLPMFGNRSALWEVLGDLSPSLVILDGVTEAMSLHGLELKDNSDVARFGHMLPSALAAAGPAVLSLDHVVKDRDARGRYAIGGAHKLNMITGCAYTLDNRQPFAVGRTGRSALMVVKDRPAGVRRFAVPSRAGAGQWFADLVLVSETEARGYLRLEPPPKAGAEGAEAVRDPRAVALMQKIVAVLAKHGPLSQRKIVAAVGGRRQTAIDALDLLILDGLVTASTPHELIDVEIVDGDDGDDPGGREEAGE